MRAVSSPLGDMDTGYVAYIHPVAGESQGRPRTLGQAESVAIEITRRVEIVRQHQVVFELGQGH